MFTGIVERKRQVERVEMQGGHGRLLVNAGTWDRPVEIGESIAVNGVCLTVTVAQGDIVGFDVLKETFEKTNLGDKKPGSGVNLERALRMGDALGGHMVSGHVDGTGTVRSITPVGRDWIFAVNADARMLDEMVKKGSISIDGVSLTIVDLEKEWFSVHLIPHTWEVTDLSDLRPGDRVNLETDMLGKYVLKMLKDRGLRL